jgi:hypothetical protein
VEQIPGYLITILRLVIPFSILRWPLAGGIAAMLADAADVMVFQAFPRPFAELLQYHTADKFLDILYYFFEFLVITRWKEKYAKRIGIALFLWRFVGYILVQITGNRNFFFYCPNIFEFFYLACLIIKRRFPKFRFDSKKNLILILLVVGIPNIIKEYYMHFLEFGTWVYFRDHFFWWMYR